MNAERVVAALGTAVLIALGCGTEPAADVSGQWDFSESIENADGSITCDGAGDLLLDLAGGSSRVSGQRAQSVTCTGGPAGFEDMVGGVHTITGGELSGSEFSFEANLCGYEGVLNAAGDQLSGTLSCELPVEGQPETFTGTWAATR